VPRSARGPLEGDEDAVEVLVGVGEDDLRPEASAVAVGQPGSLVAVAPGAVEFELVAVAMRHRDLDPGAVGEGEGRVAGVVGSKRVVHQRGSTECEEHEQRDGSGSPRSATSMRTRCCPRPRRRSRGGGESSGRPRRSSPGFRREDNTVSTRGRRSHGGCDPRRSPRYGRVAAALRECSTAHSRPWSGGRPILQVAGREVLCATTTGVLGARDGRTFVAS
jgi:hypothetical protein